MVIKNETQKTIEIYLKSMLRFIGDNPEREGLLDTPKRIVNSWKELFSGYSMNPEKILKTGFQEGACNEMVILKNIEFYSTCEHHFLPFFGEIHIGYIPSGRVVGISKLARLVECFSRRLQIQEKMTSQIADSIVSSLNPKGCIVVCTAHHLCIGSRGIKKPTARMVTSALRGVFTEMPARTEFLSMIGDLK